MTSGRLYILAVMAMFHSPWMPSAANAQSEPLLSSDYDIDLYQGMIMGSPRVIGLGGAYTGLAEGVVALPFNSAAVVQRPAFSSGYFDWDLGFDIVFPPSMQSGTFDIDNNGESRSEQYMSLSAGLLFQWGNWGVGVYVMGHTYQLDAYSLSFERLEQSVFTTRLALGYSMLGHQLLFGLTMKQGVFQLQPIDSSGEYSDGGVIFEQTALTPELGLLCRPEDGFYRFGAAFSGPDLGGTGQPCAEPNCPVGLVLPRGISMPWVVSLAGTYKLGGLPLNLTPRYFLESKEQPGRNTKGIDTYFLLIAFQVDIVGAHSDAVGSDGFISQTRQLSGQNLSVIPRLGVEAEVWPGWIRARTGFYWEPARFEQSPGRAHATLGADIKLFRIDWLNDSPLLFSAAMDISRQFQNLSFSLGFWR